MPEFADRQVIAHAPEEPVRGTPVNLVHTVSAKRELTIRDLLTMTSGLPDVGRTPTAFAHLLLAAWEGTGFLDSDTRINDPLGTVEDMVSILATLPLSSQPGEVWHYASDFDVISVLIERVSGMPLDEYFRERIFEPLGMHDSSFYCPADKLGRLVTDHQWGAEPRAPGSSWIRRRTLSGSSSPTSSGTSSCRRRTCFTASRR